jgi:hypothetical protein
MSDHTDRTCWPQWLVELNEDTSTCKNCLEDIVWGKTRYGKNVPMNPYPNIHGELESHFKTCGD